MYLDRLTNFAVFLLFILFGGLALGNSPSLDPLADHTKPPRIVALVHFGYDFLLPRSSNCVVLSWFRLGMTNDARSFIAVRRLKTSSHAAWVR